MLSISKNLYFLILVFLTGCFSEGPVYTGVPEQCNLLDDDLDGVADEDFLDDLGLYTQVENCGRCGINCADVLPTAREVACELNTSGDPVCVVTECPSDMVMVGNTYCMEQIPGAVLCMACSNDDDCALLDMDAACIEYLSGEMRCGKACGDETGSCPDGFSCESYGLGRQCIHDEGDCDCTQATDDVLFGCLLKSPDGNRICPGQKKCEDNIFGVCESYYHELCDGLDNDCDGETDEDFLISGMYIDDLHCGACNHPCVPPGKNMKGKCIVENNVPVCGVTCEDGFKDADGQLINGCECKKHDLSWPPSALGVDADCDGKVDETEVYVFVSKSGSDSNPGTFELPVATVTKGISLAYNTPKIVVVSQGKYKEEVNLSNGVSVYGGYKGDFGDRSSALYPSVIEGGAGAIGKPVLSAADITQNTIFDGFTIMGINAAAKGASSTAVYLNSCNQALTLSNLEIKAGDGTDGVHGDSSADILKDMGFTLDDLDGVSGTAGNDGYGAGTMYCTNINIAGGSGGIKVCPYSKNNVSGGRGGDSDCPYTGCTIGEKCGNAGCTDYTVDGVCDFEEVLKDAIANPAAEDGYGSNSGAAGPATYDSPTTWPGSSYCDNNTTLRRQGGSGEDGGGGTDGVSGTGCNSENGVFSLSSGLWNTFAGTDGKEGTDGSGGGGATCGSGYDVIQGGPLDNDVLGGSGGGGGSGGCAPPGSEGGKAGGGSVGIAVVLRPSGEGPKLKNINIFPGAAGDGGNGGMGAMGGSKGVGSSGGIGDHFCAWEGGRGGDGGNGGESGGAGGGCGGLISGVLIISKSIDDAGSYKGELTIEDNEIFVGPLLQPGNGGTGGFSPGNSGSDGRDGKAEDFMIFIY